MTVSDSQLIMSPMSALPKYTAALNEEISRVRAHIRGKNGIADQSKIPAARLERLVEGARPTLKEHKAITRALPRLKHFSQLLLEWELLENRAPTPAADGAPTPSGNSPVSGPVSRREAPASRPVEIVTEPEPVLAADVAKPAPVTKRGRDASSHRTPTINAAPPDKSTPKPKLVLDETRLSPPPMPPAPHSPVAINTGGRKDQYVRIETIDPDLAKLFLEANVRNRPVSLAHVKALARDMEAGKWRLTHQGLACDSEGRLVDGQHRLHAIIMSNTTQQMTVTYNVEPEAFHAIDVGGQPRTIAQIAMLVRGTKNAALVNAAAKVLWYALEANSDQPVRQKWTESEVFDLLDVFESDLQWVAGYVHGTKTLKQGPVVAAFAYAAPCDRERVGDLLDRLRSRTGMTKTMAAFWTALERVGVAGNHEERLTMYALTLRMIMYHLKGENDLRTLSMRAENQLEQPQVGYFRHRRKKLGVPV